MFPMNFNDLFFFPVYERPTDVVYLTFCPILEFFSSSGLTLNEYSSSPTIFSNNSRYIWEILRCLVAVDGITNELGLRNNELIQKLGNLFKDCHSVAFCRR